MENSDQDNDTGTSATVVDFSSQAMSEDINEDMNEDQNEEYKQAVSENEPSYQNVIFEDSKSSQMEAFSSGKVPNKVLSESKEMDNNFNIHDPVKRLTTKSNTCKLTLQMPSKEESIILEGMDEETYNKIKEIRDT